MNASVRLLEETLPATVHLRVAVPEGHPSAAVLGAERAGTGTLVDTGGLILTVNYVVLGANGITVTLFDGRELAAELVAQDYYSGVALVAMTGGAFPALPVRSLPEAAVGDDVFILASVGESARRASSGGISSVAPFDANWEYTLDRAIYSTAMNPGLGGGPLVDTLGRVVGVVSLNLNEIGRFALAVPIEHYRDWRGELLQYGRRASRPSRAWLGIFSAVVRRHVIVAGVLPGAPAAEAGLAQGDVVLAVDDAEVTSRRDFYDRLWSRRAGERVQLQVYRNTATLTLTVVSGDVEDFFA